MSKWLQAQGGDEKQDPTTKIEKSSNTSLVFSKFGALWAGNMNANNSKKLKEEYKKTLTRALTRTTLPSGGEGFGCLVPESDDWHHYGDALSRRAALVAARNGTTCSLTTDWRFVTGTGIENPLEVGIELHPVYGVPYWPGPGVKGLTRNYVEHWIDPEINPSDVLRIFGPRQKPGDEDGAAGSVVFFDALPEPGVALEFDVMAPHYGAWYKDFQNAPGDWMSPVVIEFLTVATQTLFFFAIAPRRPKNRADEDDKQKSAEWLKEALLWLGAGAKTKAGYGRFSPPARA